MRSYVLFAAMLCAACSDATAPCEEWGGCLPGNLVIRVEILNNVFPARHSRAGDLVWGPGDTIAFRLAVENQSTALVDSFTLHSGFGQARLDHVFQRIIQLKLQAIPPLLPGERVQVVDTAVIAPETRASELGFVARGVSFSAADSALNARMAGDTIVPVLSSGLELSIVGVPGQVWMEVWGWWGLWAKWRSHVENSILLRVSNPYEVTLEPLRLSWCLIDVDYCPVDGEVQTLTPRVPPGESREIEIPFSLSNTAIRWFWDYVYGRVAICYPLWLRGTCAQFNVHLLPNFEAECTVPTIVPGEQITDQTRECDQTGSVYRFVARAGERYRVDATSGLAFIVGSEGKDNDDPMQVQITIPEDGGYYVVLDQRGSKLNASFTLVRL